MVHSKACDQRSALMGEPICIICGRYGQYICDWTEKDVCSLECRDICRNRFASERMDASAKNKVHDIRSNNRISVKGEDVPPPIASFDSLSTQIAENLNTLNCIIPTPVQMQAIPAIMTGKHTVFSAATDEGKTLAYLLPIVTQILDHREAFPDETGPLSVIIAPSRELCIQIESCAKSIMKNIPRMKTALLMGGLPLPSQLYRLECGVEMIIATPGRFLEIFSETENGNWEALLQDVLSIAVDEVDKMLEASFCDQVVEIVTILSKVSNRSESLQFIACTATVSPFLEQAIDALLHSFSGHSDKLWIHVDAATVNDKCGHSIRPRVMWTKVHEKKHLLFEFLEARPKESTLVFVASRAGADMLTDSITKKCSQMEARSVHGGKTQLERLAIMEAFTTRQVQVLVATLVLARGIHLSRLDNVLLFDLPQNISDYIHQIGRLRNRNCEKKQNAIIFVCNEDKKLIPELLSLWNQHKITFPKHLVRKYGGRPTKAQ
ncbi:unnamed protein product [Albugo candida]|uniref:RNA helicase n=1 Tax=Albugo candida TaxID=65357 RepID=A0A024G1A5_9STRA|nr:unnamed protein product [Albugo candida]|eukprot:CCI40544.1 unnamed protein product [Albugo candida]